MRDMEKGLLLLLEDFHNGKLQVFGKGCTFQQMDQVREKQEKLSRLHFDLDAQQQIHSIDNDDAKDVTFRFAFCYFIDLCRYKFQATAAIEWLKLLYNVIMKHQDLKLRL